MKTALNSSVLAIGLLLLAGCDNELRLGSPQTEKFSYDFNLGIQNWQVGYADYPTEHQDIYELKNGMRPLPSGFSGQGLMVSGHNRSDDLFMFIKRRVTGLTPSTRYSAQLKMNLLSNIGPGCMGIGGAPGEAVFMKFGYGEKEPKQDGFFLNIPKGNQANSGSQAKVIGHFAVEGATCDGDIYKNKLMETTKEQQLEFTSGADGSIWLFIGSDSGFEGLTTMYYRSVELTLTPR